MAGTNSFGKATANVDFSDVDEKGLCYFGRCTGTPPTTAGLFAPGCTLVQTDLATGKSNQWQNIGPSTAPVWQIAASQIFPNTNSAVVNAAGQTLTAAQVAGGAISRSGATVVSDTFPTAALLVAGFPGAYVGGTFQFNVINSNSGTLTFLAGTGDTILGTATVPTLNVKFWLVTFTNVTAGAEAVTYQSLGVAVF